MCSIKVLVSYDDSVFSSQILGLTCLHYYFKSAVGKSSMNVFHFCRSHQVRALRLRKYHCVNRSIEIRLIVIIQHNNIT